MNDKEHRNLERAGKADTDRILTIPNVLSFFRLALIPVIIVLYAKNEVWWAFGMLVLSGVTDVVDGWVARTYHMVSNFGKAIDPVADKLTQIAVLLCLMPMKCWWVVGILVLKEISIGIMTLLTLHHTGMVYGAGWYGKLCTAVIYLSMFVLMLWRTAPDWFLYADAALCACLILLAFVKYAIRYGGILREARADTCTSMHSRNHRAGILIGQGKSAQEAMDEVGAVVEGYYAARSAHELAQRYGVEMPISTAVYEVLYEGKSAAPLIGVLMSRTPKKESDCSWL